MLDRQEMITATEFRSDDVGLARLWDEGSVTDIIGPSLCLIDGSPGSGRIMIPCRYRFDEEGDVPVVAATAPGEDDSAANLRPRNP